MASAGSQRDVYNEDEVQILVVFTLTWCNKSADLRPITPNRTENILCLSKVQSSNQKNIHFLDVVCRQNNRGRVFQCVSSETVLGSGPAAVFILCHERRG